MKEQRVENANSMIRIVQECSRPMYTIPIPV